MSNSNNDPLTITLSSDVEFTYINSLSGNSDIATMIGSDTIVLDTISVTGAGAQPVYSVSIDSGMDNIFSWGDFSTPFENGFPEWEDFQKMCEEYPAMQIAFDKLKEFYRLCKDDWEAKKKGHDVS